VERVNVFTAESLEGRVDVGQALGSKATLMFIYDPAPDQSQSLYHYEYDEEWLLVVEGTVVVRAPDGEHTWCAATSCASRRVLPVPTS
jgi:uncharacterized cupin superfamily protein